MRILKSKNQNEWTLIGQDGKALGWVTSFRTGGYVGDTMYQSVTASLYRGAFHSLEDAMGFLAFKELGIMRDAWISLLNGGQLKIN